MVILLSGMSWELETPIAVAPLHLGPAVPVQKGTLSKKEQSKKIIHRPWLSVANEEKDKKLGVT